ncbi:hypothetical protein [Streptomyces sp. NPDC058385]|uniref:hypothetical protein n=1 Tax=Streptomyces sp. NPDC058385 TaxID=3346473 RepID=UPI003665E964
MEALTGLGLLYELDACLAVDEDGYSSAEVAEAASVLRAAHVAGQEDRQDEDEGWEALQEARQLREAVFAEWLDALTSLQRVHRSLELFPWLVSWASARVGQKTSRCEELCSQAGQLVDAGDLVLAAAVSGMEAPALPHDDPAFTPLGSPDKAAAGLRTLWDRWRNGVECSWDHPREQGYLAHCLADEMGRRRKGRDELVVRARGLLGEWAGAARAVVDGAPGERVLVARVLDRAPERGSGTSSLFDRLSEWERGVLAAYTVSVAWEGSAQLVLRVQVPEVIATCLLSGQGGIRLSYREGPEVGVVVPAPRSGEGVVPGIFDDTPVSRRRLVTVEHLRALRSTVRDAEQLYAVLSVDSGVEVVALSVLERRCAAGWQGVILAGASDLPEALLAGLEQAGADAGGAVWSSPVYDPRADGYGHDLGMAEGQRVLVRLCEGRRDVGQALRSLMLARSVADLRELETCGDDERGYPRQAFASAVWHGLLAMDPLHLEPFQDGSGREWPRGSGLPLGVLASVQAYTTDAAGRYQGRAHSPGCVHRRPQYRVDRDDELVTIEELLGCKGFNPCSKCGGYAVRRLGDTQVAYYRAAHRLHHLAQRIRAALDHRSGAETGALLEELEAFDLDPSAEEAWFPLGSQARRWEQVVDGLREVLAPPPSAV